MAQLIKFKRSTGSASPDGLVLGELAYVEGRSQLFIGASSGNAEVVVDASILQSSTTTESAKAVFKDDVGAGANTYTLKGSDLVSGDIEFTLPASLPGEDQQIVVDSSGVMTSVASGASISNMPNVDSAGVTVDDILVWDNDASEWKHITQAEYGAIFGLTSTSDATFNNVTLSGNINVQGSNALLNSETVTVRDKSVVVGVDSITTDISATMSDGVITISEDAQSDSVLEAGDSIYVDDGNANINAGYYTVSSTQEATSDTDEYQAYSAGGNDYIIHTFQYTSDNNVQTITLPTDLTVDILMVGGGGGRQDSNWAYNGNGNAGDVKYWKGLSLAAGTYNITIGYGGDFSEHASYNGGTTSMSGVGSAGGGDIAAYLGNPNGNNWYKPGDGARVAGGGQPTWQGSGFAPINDGGHGYKEGTHDINNEVTGSDVLLEMDGSGMEFAGAYGAIAFPSLDGYSSPGMGVSDLPNGRKAYGRGGPAQGTNATTHAAGDGVIMIRYLQPDGLLKIDTGAGAGADSGAFTLTVSEPLTDTNIDGGGIVIPGTTRKSIIWKKGDGATTFDRFEFNGGNLSVTSGDASTTLTLGGTQEFISVDQGGAQGQLNASVTVDFDQIVDDEEFDFGSF